MAENNSKEISEQLVTNVDRKKWPEMDIFMNEFASDVVFIVDGQRVPACKCILSAKSLVFRAMFSGKFKENDDKEVVIKDTTFDAFKTLVRFIYTEQLVLTDEQDLDSINELVKLSDRYQVYRLIDRIGDNLKSRITFENLEFVCVIAFRHNIEDLISKLREFIEINFNEFLNKDLNEMKEINDWTHNMLFEVLYVNYCKTQNSSPTVSVFHRKTGKIHSYRIL